MSYLTTAYMIGGNGGSAFKFTGENNGAILEKIWVWEGVNQIKAVKVWLSDGRIQQFGEPAGSHQEYVFQPDECFTSLSLWGNGVGTHLGAIKFNTNKGGDFFAKMTKWDLKEEHPMDVGSGYCLGVKGRSGAGIDCMGFMFLNAVQSTVLTNVNYPTIDQLIPEVAVEVLKSLTHTNETSTNQGEIAKSEKKVIKQSSWSMSKNLSSAFHFEVKAGVPEISEVSSGFSVSVGSQRTYTQEQRDERTETLSTTVNVPPKKKVAVKIIIGRASFDLPYTGTVKITCKNGSVLQYETKGQYKGLTYTDIKVKTTESDL